MPSRRSSGGLAESTTQSKLLRELADAFELPEPPKRIEVYDNSHIMGTNATGAMIVAGPEGFRNNQYRKFNIKSAQTDDDFGMMKEVLERRFARLEKEDPDRTTGRMARPAADRRWQGAIVGGVRDHGGSRGRRHSGGRGGEGTAPRPRRARGVPPPRRPRDHLAAQRAACCSTSSGCATRRTASRSGRIGRSAPRA